MAQEVGYYENNPTYTEGPFVLVNAWGFRIEAEVKGCECPTLLDNSIYRLLEREGMFSGKSSNRALVERSVDWLNQQVKADRITLVKSNITGSEWWVCFDLLNEGVASGVSTQPNPWRFQSELPLFQRDTDKASIHNDKESGCLMKK